MPFIVFPDPQTAGMAIPEHSVNKVINLILRAIRDFHACCLCQWGGAINEMLLETQDSVLAQIFSDLEYQCHKVSIPLILQQVNDCSLSCVSPGLFLGKEGWSAYGVWWRLAPWATLGSRSPITAWHRHWHTTIRVRKGLGMGGGEPIKMVQRNTSLRLIMNKRILGIIIRIVLIVRSIQITHAITIILIVQVIRVSRVSI